jgi:hypothetical protein
VKRFNGSQANLDLPHGTLEPLSGWMVYGPVTTDNDKSWSSQADSELGWIEASMHRSWDSGCGDPLPDPDANSFEYFDLFPEELR